MAEPDAASRAIQAIAGPDEFAAAFDVSRETIARLATYERLLRQWQKAVNLVAAGTLDAVWHRHFADSAQILALAPDARTWVDLGSGAGFPGLVVAILMADEGASHGVRPYARNPSAATGGAEGSDPPTRRVTLIESDTRKAAFLREVVREVALPPWITVDILSTRIEKAATQASLSRPDVVSARALAPLDRLLALAAPLSPLAAVGLFLKGKDAAAEVEAARKAWNFAVQLVPSRTQRDARIVVIRRLEAKNEGKKP